ncbi:MAG: 3-oxo-tetronate kinase [Vicinamibacterales bacterium]
MRRTFDIEFGNVYDVARLRQGHRLMLLGAIADDVTGGTDLGSVLRRDGLRVVQTLDTLAIPAGADAVVVSMKTRTVGADEARSRAGQAAEALQAAGAEQIYFKYCSTFDSTDDGNIGPVIDELSERLHAHFTIACPAYPALARTVYAGHLFVGTQLLSDSSMRHHPLTPMTDANLVRVLGRQTRARVGLAGLATIEQGPRATAARLDELAGTGHRIAVVDALFDRHLDVVAEASGGLRLVTGGAALGGALARMKYGSRRSGSNAPGPVVRAPVAMLSGSCSAATLSQVEQAAHVMATCEVDPLKLAESSAELPRVIEWSCGQINRGCMLLYSSGAPGKVQAVQRQLGHAAAAGLVEHAFGALAVALAERGVRTFVVAGGETSGAVLHALRIRMLAFGDELDSGVPWTSSLDPEGFVFALKSGNFGSRDFFVKAWERAR